ncbi:MAG: DinB family protein [Aureispira sp.]|nr:DinB family protein [Aureispira sp.]
MQIPLTTEYAAFYQPYISKIKEGEDLLERLNTVHQETQELLGRVVEEKEEYRYATGKWSIRELVQHLMDAERVMAYRALRIARNDKTDMPGFDEDDYVAACDSSKITLKQLLEEYKMLRQSTLLLFKGFDPNCYQKTGTANGSVVSVRALAAIIIGHEAHHVKVIRERYLD